MGAGSWDPGTYASTTRARIDAGTSFSYTSTAQSTGRYEVHPDLDPKKVNGPDSPLAGQNVRESRDSDEHPTSTPLTVWFDETGSMGRTPRVLQTKLAELFGLLLRKGYVEHPQVMMGAFGDGIVDRAALQVGQFESDNRIDEDLDKLLLEGNGGGNMGESMALAWYFTRFHTATDAWEKRQKKGYAFFIGDERTHEPTAEQVKRWIGDGEPLTPDLSREALAKALLEQWDAYVLVIDNGSARNQKSLEHYTALFGVERVIVVEDEEAIAETIALMVGMQEGVIDLDDGVDDLKEVGSSDSSINKAVKALAIYKDRASGVAVAGDAPADLDSADDDSVARL